VCVIGILGRMPPVFGSSFLTEPRAEGGGPRKEKHVLAIESQVVVKVWRRQVYS
jgi:hypothetical protein